MTTQTKEVQIQNKKKRKKRLLWIIPLAVVLLAVIGAAMFKRAMNKAVNMVSNDDVYTVQTGNVRSTISATGTVESADSHPVYSTQSYPVIELTAKVGDVVAEGDVLCQLDAESLKKTIREREMSLETSQATGGLSLEAAQRNYNEYASGIKNGTNASLISAQYSVQSARDALDRAQETYDKFAADMQSGTVTSVNNAKRAYENAKEAYEDAQQDVERGQTQAVKQLRSARDSAEKAFKDAVTQCEQADRAAAEYVRMHPGTDETDPQYQALLAAAKTASRTKDSLYDAYLKANEALTDGIDASEKSLDSYKSAMDSAYDTYQQAVRAADDQLTSLKNSVESAQKAYQNAQNSANATRANVDSQLESLKTSLESAKLTTGNALGEFQLQSLYDDLEEAAVKSPADGTVTAVYAKVGASGAGLLFIVEDTEHLVVETSVKGYDIGQVREGMAVVIKSDATGDREIAGTITRIAPAANKGAQGVTIATSDAEFACEVTVNDTDSGLLIGLPVRLNYVLEEQKQTLLVPYDAVYTDEDGQSCVLALEERSDGTHTLVSYPVTAGVSDDIYLAVSGFDLHEGMQVLDNAAGYAALAGQTVTPADITPDLREQMMSLMMG